MAGCDAALLVSTPSQAGNVTHAIFSMIHASGRLQSV